MTTIIGPSDGTPFDSMGDKQRVMLGADDTAGTYTIIEDTLQPDFNLGLHMHRFHAETFYIIEGTVDFTIGNQEVTATAGSVIHISPQTPHAALSSEGGKMITIFNPAGLEGR